jgi:hypothetical protein
MRLPWTDQVMTSTCMYLNVPRCTSRDLSGLIAACSCSPSPYSPFPLPVPFSPVPTLSLYPASSCFHHLYHHHPHLLISSSPHQHLSLQDLSRGATPSRTSPTSLRKFTSSPFCGTQGYPRLYSHSWPGPDSLDENMPPLHFNLISRHLGARCNTCSANRRFCCSRESLVLRGASQPHCSLHAEDWRSWQPWPLLNVSNDLTSSVRTRCPGTRGFHTRSWVLLLFLEIAPGL